MHFSKWSGAGNTFLITESPFWQEPSLHQFVTQICSPVSGFAVDGIVGLEKLGIEKGSSEEKNSWQWHFFNSDGSKAEMCGNAARCAVAYAFDRSSEPGNVKINTGHFEISGIREKSGSVKISFPSSGKIKSTLLSEAYWSGVPHLLIEADEKQLLDVEQRGALRLRAAPLRMQQSFEDSSGTNVTYYCKRAERDYFAMSFERGVENFTLACGTGAIAVAMRSVLEKESNFDFKKDSSEVVKVEMPGGHLRVDFSSGQISLAGDAIEHFSGDMQKIANRGSL